jgi:hypothetical protein
VVAFREVTDYSIRVKPVAALWPDAYGLRPNLRLSSPDGTIITYEKFFRPSPVGACFWNQLCFRSRLEFQLWKASGSACAQKPDCSSDCCESECCCESNTLAF